MPWHSINDSCSYYSCLFSTLLILYWYLYHYNYHIVPWVFVSECDRYSLGCDFLKGKSITSIFISLLQSLQLPATKYNTVLFSYLFLSQSVLNLNWLPTFKSLKASHFKIKQNITGFLASSFSQRIRKFSNTELQSFCGNNELFWSRAASFKRHAVLFAIVLNTWIVLPQDYKAECPLSIIFHSSSVCFSRCLCLRKLLSWQRVCNFVNYLVMSESLWPHGL